MSTALSIASSGYSTVVVGTDTDLLVTLVSLVNVDSEIYMLCSSNPKQMYDIQAIKSKIGHVSKYIMVLHALTGCDTVSALYRQGKTKAFKMLTEGKLCDHLNVFLSNDSTHAAVQHSGEKFLLDLYNASSYKSLDQYRFVAYNKQINRAPLTSTFELASLPPTSSAAKFHSYRAYLTVQEWQENYLSPAEWGWKVDAGGYVPIDNDRPIAPDSLLNLISCACKADGFKSSCGCRKIGVLCSPLCSKCSGQSCHNATPSDLSSLNEDECYVDKT